ncbi:MAG: hypothetical protein RLY78_1706 [Pseudomonadota bacterium]|jgi:F-type H+-transporting ATPase subunit delta|uniref:ATP synthase subunit delta n=1 Tax=Pseudaquabacterium rugosum TaxID=2984194 RepID=A0ABU9B985_9BURK|nr:F-type H+-transporting ATPase subunit delta [Pseudomonadota bacterium]
MAELATIARPYAEALFKSAPASEAQSIATQLGELAQVAADPQLRAFAADPRTRAEQVVEVIGTAVRTALGNRTRNLLGLLLENGRLEALPEISSQFRALVNAQNGSADALIQSAFPIEPAQLDEIVGALARRFGRQLKATVEIAPELIGGVRVVVGDEVLDTSVKARLQQMKVALTA